MRHCVVAPEYLIVENVKQPDANSIAFPKTLKQGLAWCRSG